ncbi:MAG: helix-turn-helix transcriptional regulator [Oscillibacter sp.]|nr:helix-turn-helix transcriptional regulator [uncultured Oscillibacter sp.]MCI8970134.1 helix-turn-helix transcriptional regulator [Oscillibacter sp.]
MLSENIKTIRKSKGLSQEELAVKLNVVRQTVSKWEQGLSVPDADLLISISQALETPVSTLLGETIAEPTADDLRAISERLEVLNLRLARRKAARQTAAHWFFILLCVVLAAVSALLAKCGSPYLGWDYSHPETAVIGVALHAFEWLFIRIAPLALAGAIAGACLTRRKA